MNPICGVSWWSNLNTIIFAMKILVFYFLGWSHQIMTSPSPKPQ